MLAVLRLGEWVTRQRIRVYSIMLIGVTLASVASLVVGSNGMNDARDRPLGTDFSNVYAAGTYAREGNAAAAYDPEKQFAREQQIFGRYTPFYGWHYPPFFLLIAGALAAFPYMWALIAWQATTLALYLRVQWKILPNQLALLAAVAFPAVLVNLTHGNNGFLTASLIGLGMIWLPARPILAGIALGLLAYKPQFGLLIPLALVAGMHWRAFASAAVTVVALALAVTALYGAEIWQAFLHSASFTRHVVLEEGGTGFYKIPTLFAWVRLWGGSVDAAYGAQLLVQLMAALGVWHLWRGTQSHEIKAAGLIVGCLLSTPYMLDYDLMAVAVALALWVCAGLRDGFAPYEKSALAIAFMVPLFARVVAEHTLLPLGVWSLLWLGCLLYRRVRPPLAG